MANKITTSIRLIESTREAGQEVAKIQGLNLSTLIETLLQKEIKRVNKEARKK